MYFTIVFLDSGWLSWCLHRSRDVGFKFDEKCEMSVGQSRLPAAALMALLLSTSQIEKCLLELNALTMENYCRLFTQVLSRADFLYNI